MTGECIPAREARIFWDRQGEVGIARLGDTKKFAHLRKSGGACWGFWQQASPEELYFRLLQQVAHLIISEGIEPAKVHKAFLVVPEYRLTLPADHPDALKDDELDLVEGPHPQFSSGYGPL